MNKWKEYQSNPRFLIAMLPGLEIARDVLIEEIESIRAAVRADYQPAAAIVAPVTIPFADMEIKEVGEESADVQAEDLKAAKERRAARQTRQNRGNSSEAKVPAGLSAGMPNSEFILEVVRRHPKHKATNAEIREAARRVGHTLDNHGRLGAALSQLINKEKKLERVDRGTVRAL